MMEQIGTADICDAFTAQVKVALPGLKAYGGLQRAAGEICIVNIDEDNTKVWDKLEEAGQSRIMVVNNQGKYCAVFGDRMASLAVKNDWQAIVINGFVRDVAIIAIMQLGMWALGTCPYKCQGKTVIKPEGDTDFLGIHFKDGQFVYLDQDGLVLAEQQLNVKF